MLKGEAIGQVGEKEHLTRAGEYRYIPLGENHRLSNRTTEPVELVEVEFGEQLGEDDIVRLVDRGQVTTTVQLQLAAGILGMDQLTCQKSGTKT